MAVTPRADKQINLIQKSVYKQKRKVTEPVIQLIIRSDRLFRDCDNSVKNNCHFKTIVFKLKFSSCKKLVQSPLDGTDRRKDGLKSKGGWFRRVEWKFEKPRKHCRSFSVMGCGQG